MSRINRFNLGLEDDQQPLETDSVGSEVNPDAVDIDSAALFDAGDEFTDVSEEDLLADVDADGTVRSIELADSQNEDRAIGVAEQLTSDAVTGLTEVREFIDATDSQDALPFIEIAVESYLRPFDLKGDAAGIGLESDGTVTVSVEKLDSMIEQLKAGQARLRAKRVTHESFAEECAEGIELPNDTATVDPTDEVAYQMTVVADDLENATDAVERAANATVDGAVAQAIAETAVETGELSLEAYRAAVIALEACRRAAGIRKPFQVNRDIVSMEIFDSARQDIGEAARDLGKRLAATIGRAASMGFMQAVYYKKVLESLRTMLNTSSFQGKGTVAVSMRYLHQDGKLPASIAGYLRSYGDDTAKLLEKFHRNAKVAYVSNLRIAAGLAHTGSIEGISKRWLDPRKYLSGQQLTSTIPGGRRLFVDRPLMAPTSKDPDIIYLDRFANLAYPTILFDRSTQGYMGPSEIPVVSSRDLLSVTDSFLLALSKADRFQAFVEQAATVSEVVLWKTGHFWKAITSALIKIHRRDMPNSITIAGHSPAAQTAIETRVLRAALYTSNRMRFHVSFDALLSFTRTISGFVSYAKACKAMSNRWS